MQYIVNAKQNHAKLLLQFPQSVILQSCFTSWCLGGKLLKLAAGCSSEVAQYDIIRRGAELRQEG